jgi:hypothetical protein
MQAFIPLQDNRLKSEGAHMYNDYLACEVCGAELTQASQRQKLDSAGYTRSYCAKCYSEKFRK